jgi:hypothetical protein
MSLYGYGLALYVVDASLSYQSVERVEWTLYKSIWLGTSGQRSGLFLEPHSTRGDPWWFWTDTSGETSVGALQTRGSH